MVETGERPASKTAKSEHSMSAFEHPIVWDLIGKGRYLQAAISKSMATLYAARFGTITSKNLSSFAAESGRLGFLLWTKEIGCAWNKSVFLGACRGGQLNILEYLLGIDCVRPGGTEACRVAAAEGHLAVLRWLRKCHFSWHEDVCIAAIRAGQLEILQFLFANRCPASPSLIADACASKNLTAVQWLHEQGFPLTITALHKAARYGSLETVQWLIASGSPKDAGACASAAMSGDLRKVQFLRSQGCPWDCYTILCARREGYHKVAQWALDNGCPEDEGENDSDY